MTTNAVWATAVGFCIALAWKYRQDIRLMRARIAALEKQQSSPLIQDPQEAEFRIERFEVVWYPIVSYSPAEKKVLEVKAGMPHCKACIEPLRASGLRDAWACARCQASFTPTLADVSILDLIAGEAKRYFLERHKDYAA